MPNPKTGTVSENIGDAITEIAGGKVNFKNDNSGNVHQIIGKTSFTAEQLAENYQAFIEAVHASKPSTVKRNLIATITMNATMGPGISVKI
jgi:large subunit ribosomal protein L1